LTCGSEIGPKDSVRKSTAAVSYDISVM
jgi:hypothetical protein